MNTYERNKSTRVKTTEVLHVTMSEVMKDWNKSHFSLRAHFELTMKVGGVYHSDIRKSDA